MYDDCVGKKPASYPTSLSASIMRVKRFSKVWLPAGLAVVLGACHLLVGVEDRSSGVADAGALPLEDARNPVDAVVMDAPPPPLPDAAPDAGVCGPNLPFGSPIPLVGVNTVGGEFAVTLSNDEREVFVTTSTQDGLKPAVYRSTRASLDTSFVPPSLVELDVPLPHWGVSLAPNGLDLYVSAGARPRRLYRTRRPTASDPFQPSEVVQIAPSPVGMLFDNPYVTGRGVLYMTRESGPQFDIYFSFLDDAGAYGIPRSLAAFNTVGTSEDWPVESTDGKTLFFASGGLASTEIIEARRAFPTDAYSTGKPLTFPQAAVKHPGWISVDGCRLYLVMENAPGGRGGADVFVAQRGR